MGYVLKTNLANKSNYGNKRATGAIKYIVVHYTANDGDTDEGNANYFNSANRNASAHYFVDDDSATLSVPEDYVAWSVGGKRYSNYKSTGGAKLYKICTNNNSISIEMCDALKNGTIMATEKTMQNTAELIKSLMVKYNIPISNVVRHFDVTGKSCPAYFVNATAWNVFKERITGISITTTPKPTVTTSSNYVYKGLDYSRVFDATFYANKYGDLKDNFGTDKTKLFNHFIKNGINEGRQAISTFDIKVYKANNSDLYKQYRDDMQSYVIHYLTYGYKEVRIKV